MLTAMVVSPTVVVVLGGGDGGGGGGVSHGGGVVNGGSNGGAGGFGVIFLLSWSESRESHVTDCAVFVSRDVTCDINLRSLIIGSVILRGVVLDTVLFARVTCRVVDSCGVSAACGRTRCRGDGPGVGEEDFDGRHAGH